MGCLCSKCKKCFKCCKKNKAGDQGGGNGGESGSMAPSVMGGASNAGSSAPADTSAEG